uniref:Retrotransposon gag domain-containing protein n=1 Tax=Hyaloperonospora arabidopsidis (strain Emoy2) TaxID=559515 RepID=M4C4F9_HYAAE
MDSVVQILKHPQQMLDHLICPRIDSSLRVDEIKIPVYTGRLEESARLFYDQMEQYFTGRGISWHDETTSGQVIAILASGLREPAAQWYSINRADITSVDTFFTELDREFVPDDLQQRLRDDMHSIKQSACRNLTDYVTRFRQVMVQVTDMSELDKIIYFQRGLRGSILQEVENRRCTLLSQTITIAMDYERSHSGQRHELPSSRGCTAQPFAYLLRVDTLAGTNGHRQCSNVPPPRASST